MRIKKLALLTLFATLSACSGGGGTSDSTEELVDDLLVNAGSNISIDENTTANLLAGSSGGQSPITYTWQVDELSQIEIVHEDTSLTNAVLTAPSTAEITTFTVTLLVSDALGTQNTDSFTLTVNPVNVLPVAQISANQIDGYNENSYPVSESIIIDGSASSDVDPQSDSNAIVSYLWQQIAGPNLLSGIDTSGASISLTAPSLLSTEQAIIRLTVSDQEQAFASADINLNLLAESETIPTVSISPIRSVFSGEMVNLFSQASSNAASASPFSAQWSANEGAQIEDATALNTAAISPVVSQNTTVTYTINASDSYRNSVSAQAEGLVLAPVVRVLNDTGVTSYANASENVNQYQTEFAGQDADYGADRQAMSGYVNKVGDGEQGFDFTRLDNNGDAIESANFDASCVRDNVTALVWQVKSNQDLSSINYVEQTFTWYQDGDNGNFAGALNTNASSCNVTSGQCNTQAYIEQINAQGLCGFFDWRMPTPTELQSIVHYGKTTPPMVDTEFFPYWGGSSNQTLWYWTSQTSADGVNDDIARNAWAYDMNAGNDGFVSKITQQYVILVRAGR